MSLNWQDVFAVAIVIAAAVYLVRTVYRMLRGGQSGCGTCGSCPAEEAKTPPLVSLDLAGKSGPAAKAPNERR
jgi:attachment p12 family protein